MDALRSQTERLPWSSGPALDPALLSTLAHACRDSEPIHFTYTAPARDGREPEPTDRWVEPHRMVSMGRRWYLVAYDRDRQDWRSFRVDRISAPRTSGHTFRPRDLPADGSTPTLLYGYGGFEIPLTPSYSGAIGRGWLEPGRAYAVANIRGGGEYGPRWHQAALRDKRHKAYEDFAAVARDLCSTGVTSPA